MKLIEFILLSLKNQLNGKLVKIYTDNQNVVHICQVESMKIELQKSCYKYLSNMYEKQYCY